MSSITYYISTSVNGWKVTPSITNKVWVYGSVDFEDLTEEEQELLSFIKYEPVSLDDLIILLDKPSQSIQYILTYLEIYGYIKRLPGQRFVRAY